MDNLFYRYDDYCFVGYHPTWELLDLISKFYFVTMTDILEFCADLIRAISLFPEEFIL
jgi:hypothetical protein